MNKVIAWVKGHLVIVICSALIVVSLPTAWFLSSGWAKKIQKAQDDRFTKEWGKVSKLELSYAAPQFKPGAEAVSIRYPGNRALIDRVKEIATAHRDEAEAVVREATAFNQDGHVVLVEGLLPEPPADSAGVPQEEFVRALVGYGRTQGAYERLLADANAQMPLDAEVVRARLETRKQDFIAEMQRARGPGELSGEEQTKLTQQLVERRIDLAQRHARNISFYADAAALRKSMGVWDKPPTALPSIHEIFLKQWDYWVFQSVVSAIGRANTDGGRKLNAETAVVKRLENARMIDPRYWVWGEETVASSPSVPENNGLVGVNESWSVTGRISNPSNQLYDVREIEITVVLDSARIPAFLAALPATNFMTVIDMDLSEVDVWEELKQGYYYGPDPVVRAKVRIETLWLRSWTTPHMPAGIKSALGVTEQQQPQG